MGSRPNPGPWSGKRGFGRQRCSSGFNSSTSGWGGSGLWDFGPSLDYPSLPYPSFGYPSFDGFGFGAAMPAFSNAGVGRSPASNMVVVMAPPPAPPPPVVLVKPPARLVSHANVHRDALPAPVVPDEFPPVVALKSGWVYSVAQYWTRGKTFHFVTTHGEAMQVPLSQLERLYPRMSHGRAVDAQRANAASAL
jgi:hypothetical protein